VVVPVYNVEKYLRECVDSVLAQTFKNFELILVDDGSPDNSGKICDEYAEKDSRVRVFHKANGGVTSARKLGVENARAEWVMFVDSDDEIFPDALEVLFPWTKNPDVDLIEGNVTGRSVAEKSAPASRGPATLVRNVNALNYAAQMSARVVWHVSTYVKLFRRETLLKSDALGASHEFWWGEDFLTLLRFSREMRRAVKIARQIYFYRKNEASCTHARKQERTAKYLLSWLEETRRTIPAGGIDGAWKPAWLAQMEYVFCMAFLREKDWTLSFPPARRVLDEIWRSREHFCRATRCALFFAKLPENCLTQLFRRPLFLRRGIFYAFWKFHKPMKFVGAK